MEGDGNEIWCPEKLCPREVSLGRLQVQIRRNVRVLGWFWDAVSHLSS